jgi:hypothetical protein
MRLSGLCFFCYLIPNFTEKKYLICKVQNMYPQLQRRNLGKICIENNNLIVVSRELHFLIRQQDIVPPLPPKKNCWSLISSMIETMTAYIFQSTIFVGILFYDAVRLYLESVNTLHFGLLGPSFQL